MLKVIDSNRLRSARTRAFLGASTSHAVVLTDYVSMEAYKGGSIDGLRKSFEVLIDYPSQVKLLFGTTAIAKMQIGAGVSSEAMIDQAGSVQFDDFCRALYSNSEQGSLFSKHFESCATDASNFLLDLADNLDGIEMDIQQVASDLPKEGLSRLRQGGPLPRAMLDRIQDDILEMARGYFDADPGFSAGVSNRNYIYRLPFRFALTNYLTALWWVQVGNGKGAKPDKFRNDVVDSCIVAYATYFNGVLSSDRKVNSVYEHACHLLEHMFGATPGPVEYNQAMPPDVG